MEKALVAGGAGFIGSHLVDALASRRFDVDILDNLSSGTRQNIEPQLSNPNIKFTKGDLLNSAPFQKIRTQSLRNCLSPRRKS